MNLSFEELKIFVELAQSTSLRELARRKKINPSQISKKISTLEKKVGKKLLKRSVSGIALSSDGIRFWKAATRTLEVGRELMLDASTDKTTDALPGKVYSIAGASYLNHHLLPSILANLRRAGSSDRFQLLEISGKDLISTALKGQFEIALHIGKKEWPKSWTSKRVGTFPSRLYSRAGHLLGTHATEDEVRKFRFVMPIHHLGSEIKFGDDNCPLPIEKRMPGDSATTADGALEWIRVTDQLAYLPRVVAKRARDNREIEEITVDNWSSNEEDLYVTVKADQVPARMLNEIVAELAKKLMS